jgi:Protein of unknown function (DUF1566)
MRILALVMCLLTLTVAQVHGECVGDCSGDKVVTINEIVTCVNIDFGSADLSICPACSSTVAITDLIAAVNNALNGCVGGPTPRPTSTAGVATPTPTIAVDQFIDDGDGTITDANTGLIWEKKDEGGGLHDVNTSPAWAGRCSDTSADCQPDAASASTCSAATGGAEGCTQCSTTATCNLAGKTETIWGWLNQLNAADFAGHSDWRIPTVGKDGGRAELETLLDPSAPGCAVNGAFGPPCVPPAFETSCTKGCTVINCSCTLATGYQSATTVADSPDRMYNVGFGGGGVINLGKQRGDLVRAVRGGL